MSSPVTTRPLLATLPDAVQQQVLAECVTRRYKKGAQLFRENEHTRDLYLINYGMVRVTRYSEQGAKVSYIDITAGGMFGEISAIDGLPRSANVLALEETSVTVMRQALFNQLLDTQPTFSRHIFERLCRLVRRLDERIYEFTTLGVRNRIHAELLRMVSEDGVAESEQRVRLDRPLTHEELAARISTHREAVSREFQKLKKMGLIETKGRQIIVNNIEQLQKMVDEVHAA